MTGTRIADLPDLGAMTDLASVIGESAGSGRFAAAAVRSYVQSGPLTGLSTGTNAAIVPTDTVLVALGKLQAQLADFAHLLSPPLTGTPTAPTAVLGTNSVQIATTAFCAAAVAVLALRVADIEANYIKTD